MARILLVDDEADVRQMLRDALELLKHSVDAVGSAREALAKADSESYEVAIIDYVLPGMRGLDLLQQLRIGQPFLRSIIVSGQIDHDVLGTSELERQLKEQVAADRYIPKPASTDALERAIQDVLKPAEAGDWRQMASDAVAGSAVKKKNVQALDKTIQHARRKKK